MSIAAALGFIAFGFFVSPFVLFAAFRRALKVSPQLYVGIASVFGQRALSSASERGDPMLHCPTCSTPLAVVKDTGTTEATN